MMPFPLLCSNSSQYETKAHPGQNCFPPNLQRQEKGMEVEHVQGGRKMKALPAPAADGSKS